MDKFKEKNQKEIDWVDYDVPQYVKRAKGDGERFRRLARRRLKQELRKELRKELNKED